MKILFRLSELDFEISILSLHTVIASLIRYSLQMFEYTLKANRTKSFFWTVIHGFTVLSWLVLTGGVSDMVAFIQGFTVLYSWLVLTGGVSDMVAVIQGFTVLHSNGRSADSRYI